MSKSTKTTKAVTATPPGPSNGHHITDIPHEVVDQPGNDPLPAVLDSEAQIKLEISKFGIADAGILSLKEKYSGLTIAGADDKEGYKTVREAWGDVRSRRTGLEKKGLELRNRYKVITTAISKEEDRLIDLLTPLETDLHAKWKAIDDEKERIKKEAEAEEQRLLMVRVEEVMKLGMFFRDGFYVIGETISLDVATLRAMPEENYAKLKEAIKAKKAELDKIESDAAAERQRQADEFRRQQEELKKQQEEIARQQREMAEQKWKMEEEQKQINRDRLAAAQHKMDMRINTFLNLGMVRHGEQLDYDNGWTTLTLQISDIQSWNDNSLAEMYNDWKMVIAKADREKADHDAEVKKEQEALDNKKKYIAEAMRLAGLSFSYTMQAFYWEDKNTAISIPFAELIPLTENDIIVRADEIKETIQKAKSLTEKQAKDQAEKEAEDKKLSMKDADRFTSELAAIGDAATKMIPGQFKTAKFQKKSQGFLTRLTNLLNEYQ